MRASSLPSFIKGLQPNCDYVSEEEHERYPQWQALDIHVDADIHAMKIKHSNCTK